GHRGEGLVPGGVDERDLPFLAVDLGVGLVRADVLGDPAGLVRHQVRVPDRVEQLGLAVVDVAHNGHHRRAGHEVACGARVLAELDVEGLQQLAVLFLGRDHLDRVIQLGPEQLQRLVVHRLRRCHHLAQVEQHLDQRGGGHADLVGEVAQRRAPRQPDDLPAAARDLPAADRRRLPVVELPAPLPAPARAPEGALRAAPAAAAAGTGRGAGAGPLCAGTGTTTTRAGARTTRARAAAAARPGAGARAPAAAWPARAGETAGPA